MGSDRKKVRYEKEWMYGKEEIFLIDKDRGTGQFIFGNDEKCDKIDSTVT